MEKLGQKWSGADKETGNGMLEGHRVIWNVTVWLEQLGKCQSQLAPSVMPGGRSGIGLGQRRKEGPGHSWPGGRRIWPFPSRWQSMPPSPSALPLLALPGADAGGPPGPASGGPAGMVPPAGEPGTEEPNVAGAAPELNS